jgi:hypothetical protein
MEDQVDMGYEEAPPSRRRGSMTQCQQSERRASIKAIMNDDTMTPMTKRLSIQHLMDGRRSSLTGGSSVHSAYSNSAASSVSGGGDSRSGSYGSNPYGYEKNDNYNSNDNAPLPDTIYGYGDSEELHPQQIFSICNEQTQKAELSRPYCSHYERQCTIISPCCGMTFGCRICHDDCPSLPPKINNGGRKFHRSASLPSSFTSMDEPHPQEDAHHEIDRFSIREIICRECFTRQSSKTYVYV